MKTKFVFTLSLVLVLCGALWSCSDDAPIETGTKSNTASIQEFLNSEYGIITLESHGLSIQDLDLDNAKCEVFESKGVTSFSIPIIENGIVTGRLNAFIVPGNEPYRAIVEKWNMPHESGYSVTVSTGKGTYLATVEISENGKQKIIDIASDTLSRSNRPAGEGWWACTTRVYATAKQACSGDSQCDFLCDIVDLAKGCTISMAAAAAIVCI